MNLYNWTQKAQTLFRQSLFPDQCLLCASRVRTETTHALDVCASCKTELPWNHHACPRCALPLPEHAPANTRCARCQQKTPCYDWAVAPLIYKAPIDQLHQRLKFSAHLANARLLSGLVMDVFLSTVHHDIDMIIPVPLHPARLRLRGFNQAVELLKPLTRQIRAPINTRACRRSRVTQAQHGLSAKARRQNIKGAFVCNANLQAQKVIIFDDVMTTGETVNELARVLKKAGAREVGIWAVARAPVSSVAR